MPGRTARVARFSLSFVGAVIRNRLSSTYGCLSRQGAAGVVMLKLYAFLQGSRQSGAGRTYVRSSTIPARTPSDWGWSSESPDFDATSLRARLVTSNLDRADFEVHGLFPSSLRSRPLGLLARISGSTRAVGHLSKLIAIKTAVQYTGKSMAERQATDAITQALRLIEFTESQRRG